MCAGSLLGSVGATKRGSSSSCGTVWLNTCSVPKASFPAVIRSSLGWRSSPCPCSVGLRAVKIKTKRWHYGFIVNMQPGSYLSLLNPLSPNSDQHQISLCNINAYYKMNILILSLSQISQKFGETFLQLGYHFNVELDVSEYQRYRKQWPIPLRTKGRGCVWTCRPVICCVTSLILGWDSPRKNKHILNQGSWEGSAQFSQGYSILHLAFFLATCLIIIFCSVVSLKCQPSPPPNPAGGGDGWHFRLLCCETSCTKCCLVWHALKWKCLTDNVFCTKHFTR